VRALHEVMGTERGIESVCECLEDYTASLSLGHSEICVVPFLWRPSNPERYLLILTHSGRLPYVVGLLAVYAKRHRHRISQELASHNCCVVGK
jgi:hypothetical protein